MRDKCRSMNLQAKTIVVRIDSEMTTAADPTMKIVAERMNPLHTHQSRSVVGGKRRTRRMRWGLH